MKIINTSSLRKNIAGVIDQITRKNTPFAVGRRNKIEALIIKYPENLNETMSDVTNFNANSPSFDFLNDEPELYNVDDLKKRYV